MCFSGLNTSGQPRHITVHTCVYHASPRCWDFVLPTALSLEGQRALCTVITSVCRQTSARFVSHGLAKKKHVSRTNIHVRAIPNWHDKVICDLQKSAGHDTLMTYFPVTSLSGAVSGRISVYTAKDMWSNASQTTSASGLITVRLGEPLHSYLTLYTCDLIAQDAC